MAFPIVSIIIPNYNYARYLDERFHSILDQTVTDYEVIFLDDASTDNSMQLAREKYGQYISQMEVNTKNSGNPFVQWNKGVRLSRGEYVWIAEADDFCAPNFLERMLSVMRCNSSVGLAYCNTLPVGGDGAILDEGFFQRYVSDLDSSRWLNNFTAQGLSEVRHYLARKNTITNVSGVLFRRDAYVRAGYAPEDLSMCGDWMTYCRVLRDTDIAYVSAPLNFHRQHPTKQTQNSVLNLTYFREFLQVQDYLIREFHLSRREKQASFRRFLGEWDRLTLSNYGRLNLKQTLVLADMTGKAYQGFGYFSEIALHLFFNSIKSVAGKWMKN